MYNNQYQGQDRYGFTPLDNGRSLVNTVSSTMKRVYFKMTLALIVTAFTALGCANNGFIEFMYTNSWMMWVLIIAEFGLVLGISAGINKMSSTVATALFYLFAVVNGLMLSSIFVVYSMTAIVKTFFITAGHLWRDECLWLFHEPGFVEDWVVSLYGPYRLDNSLAGQHLPA